MRYLKLTRFYIYVTTLGKLFVFLQLQFAIY